MFIILENDMKFTEIRRYKENLLVLRLPSQPEIHITLIIGVDKYSG